MNNAISDKWLDDVLKQGRKTREEWAKTHAPLYEERKNLDAQLKAIQEERHAAVRTLAGYDSGTVPFSDAEYLMASARISALKVRNQQIGESYNALAARLTDDEHRLSYELNHVRLEALAQLDDERRKLDDVIIREFNKR